MASNTLTINMYAKAVKHRDGVMMVFRISEPLTWRARALCWFARMLGYRDDR